MTDLPRVIIRRVTCPKVQPEQVEAFKASYERWQGVSTPAADGVDWEEADGRLVAVVWRWEVAA